MQRAGLILLGCVFLSLPFFAFAAGESSPDWVPEPGDRLIVDVSSNTGYLVHEDGTTLPFPVATGQKAYVHYIGRSYRAETPVRSWTAEQLQIKGDRRTFGKSGRFLRLFRDGESSPYGIHSYFRVDEWMTEEERYFSMGCIVVTEDILSIIEETFRQSGEKMTVVTTKNATDYLQQVAVRAN